MISVVTHCNTGDQDRCTHIDHTSRSENLLPHLYTAYLTADNKGVSDSPSGEHLSEDDTGDDGVDGLLIMSRCCLSMPAK